MSAKRPEAPRKRLVRVKVHLHIELTDDRDFILIRDAPTLPSGVSWQVGMMFQDRGNIHDDDYEGWDISSINVDDNGRCSIHLYDKHPSASGDEYVADLMQNGWTVWHPKKRTKKERPD